VTRAKVAHAGLSWAFANCKPWLRVLHDGEIMWT